MAYTLPADAGERPVAVDGAGTLGRRIAAVYAAGGGQVRIFDPSPDQCDAAVAFISEQVDDFKKTLGVAPQRAGAVEVADDLESAVRGAWMVVEAAPERLEVKREVLAELDRLADPDAIVASNSSSLPTSRLIGDVAHPERVLNTHYYMPPAMNAVELMSCGETDEGIIQALVAKLPDYGLAPFHVRRESDGFIFNRIWAAIKRECLMVVEEGVAPPSDVDGMWNIFVRGGVPPFELMDRVGLDVVLDMKSTTPPSVPGSPRGRGGCFASRSTTAASASKAGKGSTSTPPESAPYRRSEARLADVGALSATGVMPVRSLALAVRSGAPDRRVGAFASGDWWHGSRTAEQGLPRNGGQPWPWVCRGGGSHRRRGSGCAQLAPGDHGVCGRRSSRANGCRGRRCNLDRRG